MRWLTLAVAGGLLIAGVVGPAQAQEEREECVCRAPFGRLHIVPGGDWQDWTDVYWAAQRPRLGVYVNTQANPETDRYGALVNRVTGGGPADKAGVREGDIITKLAGRSLLEGDETYEEDESVPGMRLIERARELEIGDTVEVEYRRDGETETTQLAVGDFDGSYGYSWTFRLPDYQRLQRPLQRLYELPEIHVRGPESFALRLGVTLPGLELVSLNPDLGQYFGTTEGVLVVSMPEESELELKSGDVILQIDGREVKDPSHAMRILRSYDADEEVSFTIMRNQKQMTVTGRVPERLGTGPEIIRERFNR